MVTKAYHQCLVPLAACGWTAHKRCLWFFDFVELQEVVVVDRKSLYGSDSWKR
jgi:hypothetical protein